MSPLISWYISEVKEPPLRTLTTVYIGKTCDQILEKEPLRTKSKDLDIGPGVYSRAFELNLPLHVLCNSPPSGMCV